MVHSVISSAAIFLCRVLLFKTAIIAINKSVKQLQSILIKTLAVAVLLIHLLQNCKHKFWNLTRKQLKVILKGF